MKKILSLLMACTLTFGLAACGNPKSSEVNTPAAPSANADTNSTTAADPGSNAPASTIDTSKEVEVTMLVLGNRPTNGRMEAAIAEENKILKEKVNASIKLHYIEWADWQTQYQLALAGGDSSIDLVVTATDWLFAWQLTDRGAFLPLNEEMLSTYAPQTWNQVPAEHWAECTKDGQIWFIPEDQYTQWTNHGMFWRKDWATEAGVEKVTNFQELGAYFAGVKANHPEAYPWDVSAPNNLGGLLGGYIADNTNVQNILSCETGNFNVFYYSNDDPYTVSSAIFDDVFVDFAKLMKEWADAGYWRQDVLNYQGETRDLMYAGTSGADQHHGQTYVSQTRPNMDLKQPGSDLQMFWWGMSNGNYNRDLITHGAMAVSATSRNPERALMVYDLIRNDETVYRLHNYGIEGVDYVDNGDGTMGRPEGWDKTTDALDTNFWAGRNDNLELVDEFIYDGWKDVYAAMAANCRDYPLSKFTFDTTAVQAEMSAMADVCATHIPSIAYGKAGDAEAAVTAFRDGLKAAGFDKVLAEIQTQLDALKSAS